MTAPNGRGRGAPRVAQWRKPAHPIWRAPPSVACRGEDIGLFYPAEGESAEDRKSRVEKATDLCRACCAAAACLESAMEEERAGGARFGIRGGRTPVQRRALQTSRTLRERRARERAQKEAEKAA